MKIVINSDFGGFGVSEKVDSEMGYKFNYSDRTNPQFVEIVERLGEEANDCSSHLKVIEIPDNIEWEIFDFDGQETIVEKGRYWK
jgi:hypothetical protein